MNFIKSSGLLIIITLLGIFALILSIYDIISDGGWMFVMIASYAVLIIITILLFFLRSKKDKITKITVNEFEKTLKGGLYHYKCQTCSGIFAIKKSKSNNKKYVRMTCPDCGAIGVVSPNPKSVEEEIPEKKSAKANFKCDDCGEGITVWAEGTDLYQDMYVYSCPFCGKDETMKYI